jgi:hypothetical protein
LVTRTWQLTSSVATLLSLDLRRQSRPLVVTLVKGGLYWIEEPTGADAYSGHATIRRDSKTPIQIGENWWGPHDAAKSLEVGTSDYFRRNSFHRIGGNSRRLRLHMRGTISRTCQLATDFLPRRMILDT